MRIDGHAVEVRLIAEDVDNGFRPSPGTLTRFDVPAGSGLRVDTHCRAGDAIPPHYDSLLAKLIAHGPTRAQALANLSSALEELAIEGVATNRELLLDLVKDPRFVAADVTTSWLEDRLS